MYGEIGVSGVYTQEIEISRDVGAEIKQFGIRCLFVKCEAIGGC